MITLIFFGIFSFVNLNVSASKSIDDELTLKVTPEKPNPGDEVSLQIVNKSGASLGRIEVRVYDPNLNKIVDKFVSEGKVELKSSDTNELGIYKVAVSGYSGYLNFSVKKNLWYAGPNPEKPVVNEMITMSVPQGVGVKIFDSKGDLYLACKTFLDNFGKGQVNFTIDKPGDYTIKIGEISRVYWGENLSLRVYERGELNFSIKPKKPTVDEEITILITSNALPVENAMISIESPSGKIKTAKTSSNGKITYLPSEIGEYSIYVEKERYKELNGKFSVYNSFKIDISPPIDEIGIKDLIVISIKDQTNIPVNNANFYIKDKGINLSSNSDGKVRFSLSDAGSYNFVIKKYGFWDFDGKIDVLLPLKLSFYPENKKLEIGNKIKIKTFSYEGKEISTEKEIKKPNGDVEFFSDDEYEPSDIGRYYIKVKTQGYKTVNDSFDVVPKPIEIEKEIKGKKVIISVKSHSEPVQGIGVFVETPIGVETTVTNDNGVIEMEIPSEGEFRIYVNLNRKNKLYEEKILSGYIKKEYRFALLFLIILLILLFATLFVTKPWEKEKEVVKEEIKNKDIHKKKKKGKYIKGDKRKPSLRKI